LSSSTHQEQRAKQSNNRERERQAEHGEQRDSTGVSGEALAAVLYCSAASRVEATGVCYKNPPFSSSLDFLPPPQLSHSNGWQSELSILVSSLSATDSCNSQRLLPPTTRQKSSSSKRSLKPSLLPLSTKASQTKAKKGKVNKSRDMDERAKLDEASRVELRKALEGETKVRSCSHFLQLKTLADPVLTTHRLRW
jgi:hypothetical protein